MLGFGPPIGVLPISSLPQEFVVISGKTCLSMAVSVAPRLGAEGAV